MANQRKEGKKQTNTWIDEELFQEMAKKAKLRGVPMSTIVREYIEQGVKRDKTGG